MQFSENISVKDFFTKEVPKIFEEGIKKVATSELSGTVFHLEFNITGEAGARYCLKIKDGKELEIIEGGVPKPELLVELSEKDFRDSITGKVPGALDQFMNPEQAASKKQMDAVKAIAGTLNLELKKPDGNLFKVKIKFNSADSPSCTIKMDMDDYAKMVKKEVAGPALFMEGKLGFEGDMTFLMQLQSVIG